MRVHFRIHIDGPDPYQSLRWELLRDPNVPTANIATSPRMIMSRYLLSTEWKLINDVPDRELKALVVIAAPNNLDEFRRPGRNLADVNRSEEESIASRALAKFPRRFLGGDRRASIKEITRSSMRDATSSTSSRTVDRIATSRTSCWRTRTAPPTPLTPGTSRK